MSGGKGGSTTSTTSIPKWLEDASKANLEKANEIAQLGPMRNYGPSVAAFNPTQTAGFQNTADLASAFGMNAPTDVMAGMPQAQDFGGGVMGYSAAPIVDQQLASLQQNAPDQAAAYSDLFMDPGGPGLFPAIEANQRRLG
tara:strand:+ start:114 stop:536 length:423 start_codon:yes stop_codon:yes gene_type:complete